MATIGGFSPYSSSYGPEMADTGTSTSTSTETGTDTAMTALPAVPAVVRGVWLLFGGMVTGIILTLAVVALFLIVNGTENEQVERDTINISEQVTSLDLEGDLGEITVAAATDGTTETVIERSVRWAWQKPAISEEVFGEHSVFGLNA